MLSGNMLKTLHLLVWKHVLKLYRQVATDFVLALAGTCVSGPSAAVAFSVKPTRGGQLLTYLQLIAVRVMHDNMILV